ncbi:MAG TPA: hypothetical protein PLA46_11975, partial [Phycicoccus sp.]|nr:hypothetical protein [Phycicoccus sp.]
QLEAVIGSPDSWSSLPELAAAAACSTYAVEADPYKRPAVGDEDGVDAEADDAGDELEDDVDADFEADDGADPER